MYLVFFCIAPLTRAPRAAAVRADHNLATRTETSATTSSRHPLPLPLPPYPNATRKISTAVGLSPPEPALSCQKSTDPNNVGKKNFSDKEERNQKLHFLVVNMLSLYM